MKMFCLSRGGAIASARFPWRANGQETAASLPDKTDDPHVAGQLWNNAGVLNVSAG
jgi:hypothetical protein